MSIITKSSEGIFYIACLLTPFYSAVSLVHHKAVIDSNDNQVTAKCDQINKSSKITVVITFQDNTSECDATDRVRSDLQLLWLEGQIV